MQQNLAAQDRALQYRHEWLAAWPGLAALWLRGDLRGLLLALLFAVGVNGALIDTWVWPELFAIGSPLWLWAALAIVWICGFFGAIRQLSASDSTVLAAGAGSDALFIQAQTEYLSGHWDEAAWLLERRLADVPRDAEARLLLATLRRHQRQFAAAADQLQTLRRFDEARRWTREIEREQELADQFQAFAAEDSGEPESTEGPATKLAGELHGTAGVATAAEDPATKVTTRRRAA